MATEYLTTDIDLKKVADGIRSRTGKTTPIAFPDGYVTEISTLTNTSDATATASDIAKGKTAYGASGKVTGNVNTVASGGYKQFETKKNSVAPSSGDAFAVIAPVSSSVLFRAGSKIRSLAKLSDLGNATTGEILNGKTCTSAAGLKIAGTMPNNGAAAIQLSDLTAKPVTAGYYSGGTAKVADAEAAKIIPENIKKGVTILGVEGTMEAGYDTSDATVTAGDMSYGVVAYGKDGQVYGGVPTIDGTTEKALGDSTVGFHGGLGKIQLSQRIPRLGMLFREGSTVILRASPSEFGDATAADVAKGKTFTSAAGLKVVGTAAGGGGGSGGRPPVSLTITVDPTNAPEGWSVDVLGPFGSFYTFDANNPTVTISDWTSGDMFVVWNNSMEPSTRTGYLDRDSTECVNCYFDLTDFASNYISSKSSWCLYACQIESGLSAGAEATMTIKFH